ncbi:hypothetical protein [Mesorhizobium sp.]|uniref:hypothetical protein n=1 Tax=Mesorhizobium sp. TaxID=1871066 RepID=UPI000FE42C71|nr:hypothetical protein [Mesorhizobium sp.]RWK39280.1 MAG: hypothetical protein EOR40_04520 [Mesorhizobium sp.]
MIRLIIRTDDASMAANVGGSVLTQYRTFDVELPEVESLLRAGGSDGSGFSHRQLVGCEILDEPS